MGEGSRVPMKERNRIVVQEMESEEKREREIFKRHKNNLKKQMAAMIREQAKL